MTHQETDSRVTTSRSNIYIDLSVCVCVCVRVCVCMFVCVAKAAQRKRNHSDRKTRAYCFRLCIKVCRMDETRQSDRLYFVSNDGNDVPHLPSRP